MPEFEVIIDGADGNRYTLSDIAPVTGVTYATDWGVSPVGGCGAASWSAALPAGGLPPWLRSGAWAAILAGPVTVWQGRLSEPTPGPVTEFYGVGLGKLAEQANIFAVDADDAPTSAPRVAVQQAIADGLPWLLPDPTILSNLPMVGVTEAEELIHPLSSLLAMWLESVGKRAGVFADGQLRVAADPTTPTFLARGLDPYIAVADDKFVTHLNVRYITEMAGDPPEPTLFAWTTVGDDTIPFANRVYEKYDLAPTKRIMTELTAHNLGEQRLKLLAPRSGWTAPLSIGPGQLFTIDGTPCDPAFLTAGVRLAVEGIFSPSKTLDLGGRAEIVVAGTDFDAESGTAKVTPLGLVPRDFTSILTAAIDPRRARLYNPKPAIDDYAEAGANA